MQRLEAVEQGRKLMLEADDWSPWDWINGKQKLREAVDRADQALDDAEEAARRSWSDQLRRAYVDVQAVPPNKDVTTAPALLSMASKLKQSEDAAWAAREKAKQTFSDAERNLSISMARDGIQLAIEAWNLREQMVEQFEAMAESNGNR